MCVITLWSQHSVGSDWVRAESGWAKDNEKLVSIRIDDKIKLPIRFYNVHTLRGCIKTRNGLRRIQRVCWLGDSR